MRVRIEIGGIFGIGSTSCPFPGFAARAVDFDRPFSSETGYRSFLGIHAEPVPGMTTDEFIAAAIAARVRIELKGRLRAIKPERRGE